MPFRNESRVFLGSEGRPATRGAVDPNRRVAPCSTFKLLLAVEALHTGLVKDADAVSRFHGKRSGRPTWDRDQSLRQALQASTEWYFQDIAVKLGPARLAAAVKAHGYGSGWRGRRPERAWHDGSLTISPIEQARFTSALDAGKLARKPEHQAIVRACLTYPIEGGRSLWGKTGSGDGIAWFVGAIEGEAFAVLVLEPRVIGPDIRARVLKEAAGGQFPARPRATMGPWLRNQPTV